MNGKLLEFVVVGVAFGVAGSFAAGPAGQDGKHWLNIIGPLSAALTATAIWPFAMARYTTNSWWIGSLWGVLIGLLSHPVCWYVLFLTNWMSHNFSGGTGDPIDPITGLYACLVYSFFSWIAAGGPTILAGFLAGFAAGTFRTLLDRLLVPPPMLIALKSSLSDRV